MSLRFLG
ncbi:hypothetical protein AYI68_g2733, partial [Smittium mucronatum]